ncbi:hypothetical protein RCL1_001483 [Eukaryota sp. TZLM3-RCL]
MVWNLSPSLRAFRWTGHSDVVVAVDFHPDGNHLASVSRDGTVRIWKSIVSPVPLVISNHSSPLRCVSWSSHGELLAVGGDDKVIRVYSIESLNIGPLRSSKRVQELSATSAGVKFSHSFQGHNHWVNCIRFQPGDCSLLASGGEDGRLCVYDRRIGSKPILVKKETGGPIYSIDYSADGKLIVTGSADGRIRLYDLQSATLIALFEGHKAAVRSVRFGLGNLSNLIVSGSDDTSCRVWSITHGCGVYSLYGHSASVLGVAMLPDVCGGGSKLSKFATCGGDHILLWQVDSSLLKKERLIVEDVVEDELNHDIADVSVSSSPPPMESFSTFPSHPVSVIGTGAQTRVLQGLPDELSSVFESISAQLDLINRRLDVFETRLSNLEARSV